MQKQKRKANGRYAKDETKNILAVAGTIFIVLAVAFYAKELSIKEMQTLADLARIETTKAKEQERHCLLTGEGTGKLQSYCADTPERLEEIIKGETLNLPNEAQNEPVTKSAPRQTSYKRKHFDPKLAELIKNEAQKQGYSDLELALDIVDCESTWDPEAVNTKGNTPSTSKDLGLWQYNDYWQRNNLTKECMLDAECSTRQAIKDLKAGKAHQWACYRIVR